MIELVLWGALAFMVSFIATVFVRLFATKSGLVDVPTKKRNIHKIPIAKFGGFAIFIAAASVIALALYGSDVLTGGQIAISQYVGIIIAGGILMVGGYLDDRYTLEPKFQIISPILAATIAVLFGIEISKLTNPLGGVIVLDLWQSNILVFVWLMVVMYTTKFLDGLDGLATSVSSVGVIMIMMLSLSAMYFQPDVSLLSSIIFGAYLGFLFWNIHPAAIFLGEGGSTLVGFFLGVLAVISGGKVATALLVLGIPLLDIVWVIVRRFRSGGIKGIVKADRQHLHHRLLDIGFSQTHIVLIYSSLAGLFGMSALFLQSKEKLIALVVLAGLMALSAIFITKRQQKI